MDYDKLKALRDSIHGDCYRGEDWEVQTIDELLADRTQSAPTVAEPDERAAFEAWIKQDAGDLSAFGQGQNMHYSNSAVNNSWTGWKARASLALLTPKAEADYCTDPDNCKRCKTLPQFRTEQMFHAGIGKYPRKAQPAVEPVAASTQKNVDDAFWAWWEPYELSDHWFVELHKIARDAWRAAIASTTAPAPNALDALTQAARDVLDERQRQIDAKGYEPEADDAYEQGELASAAATYALLATGADGWRVDDHWPWAMHSLKKGDPRRMLVKSAALNLAEIERIDRAAIAAQSAQGVRDGAN